MDRPQALDTIIECEREKKKKKMENIIINSKWKGWLQTDFVSLFTEKTDMITHNLIKAIN